MAADLPNVRRARRAEHGRSIQSVREGGHRPPIQVNVIEGVFTAPQKREIVERLTEAMVEIEGESMRPLTWCVVDEVAKMMSTRPFTPRRDTPAPAMDSACSPYRTLSVVASGTLLVMSGFSAFVVTVADDCGGGADRITGQQEAPDGSPRHRHARWRNGAAHPRQ